LCLIFFFLFCSCAQAILKKIERKSKTHVMHKHVGNKPQKHKHVGNKPQKHNTKARLPCK